MSDYSWFLFSHKINDVLSNNNAKSVYSMSYLRVFTLAAWQELEWGELLGCITLVGLAKCAELAEFAEAGTAS